MKQKYKYTLKFFLLTIGLSLVWGLSAQDGTVSGLVTDAKAPLIGATVVVASTTTGAVTDLDGNYSLTLPPGTYTIEASYAGYSAQQKEVTVTAGGSFTLDFTLQEGSLV